MATYTVATGDKSVGPIVLTASQVDSIVFTDNVGVLDCINDGAGDVYLTADGRTPAVPTAGSSSSAYRVPPNTILQVQMDQHADTLKVVSAGTPSFSVQQSAAS